MYSFLNNKESSLMFDEQTSAMRLINASISQRFLISLILFLFFNIYLIEKCKTLSIKIKILNFINNINILIYDKTMKLNYKTLSRAYEVCIK